MGKSKSRRRLRQESYTPLRSSKSQAPSTREAPSSKLKYRASVDGVSEWREESAAYGSKESAHRHPFDLEERTARFGEAIVRFCKKIPRSPANDRLIGQLAGAGTSVGANYCEANESVSKEDFRNTIARCAKEAKETKFFLRMVAASEPQLADEARMLYREAKELHLIFCAMRRT